MKHMKISIKRIVIPGKQQEPNEAQFLGLDPAIIELVTLQAVKESINLPGISRSFDDSLVLGDALLFL